MGSSFLFGLFPDRRLPCPCSGVSMSARIPAAWSLRSLLCSWLPSSAPSCLCAASVLFCAASREFAVPVPSAPALRYPAGLFLLDDNARTDLRKPVEPFHPVVADVDAPVGFRSAEVVVPVRAVDVVAQALRGGELQVPLGVR